MRRVPKTQMAIKGDIIDDIKMPDVDWNMFIKLSEFKMQENVGSNDDH